MTPDHHPTRPGGDPRGAGPAPADASSPPADSRPRTDEAPARAEAIVVAIDGPSGSGKSSTSRAVARRLGLRYLDTGAMYRALTHWVLVHGIDAHDPDAVAEHAHRPSLGVGTDPVAPTITVDGMDVSAAIRSTTVTGAVSAVSAVPAVRARLVEMQRAAIAAGGIVVEGRDIGTAVAPNAAVKVYLVASAEARAARRHAELGSDAGGVAATGAALGRRDALDSTRATSPLARAADAVEVDSTDRTLDEVVDLIVGLVDAATGRVADRS